MKIIRFNKDDLDMNKDIIRKKFEFDNKDNDNEIYRILVPMVPNTNYLANIVDTFVESKSRVKDFDSKYSFHCANHMIVSTIKESINNGTLSDYHEFDMPLVANE